LHGFDFIDRGARIVELFKQPQYNPIPVQTQAVILWSMQKGFFDTIPVDKIKTVQSKLVEFMETRKSAILDKVSAKRQFDEEVEKELKAALEEFKSFNTL